jgi:hypothetical protein
MTAIRRVCVGVLMMVVGLVSIAEAQQTGALTVAYFPA